MTFELREGAFQCQGVRIQKPWRRGDDGVLGTRPDAQIAMLLGRSLSNVSWRRRKLRHTVKTKRPWTIEGEAILCSRPDTEQLKPFAARFAAVQASANRVGYPTFASSPHCWPNADPVGRTPSEAE